MSPLARLGAIAAQIPAKANDAFDFSGQCAAALPKLAAPGSVDWCSLPKLMQEIGADGLPVASAANLLVGVIVGFLGVSQLGRFGAIAFVPELVVVAHFRELGPLVTAIECEARTRATRHHGDSHDEGFGGIDALRAMGFDPIRWLIAPRCLALVLSLPLLTWIGDLMALAGGLAATLVITNMPARAYIEATLNHITAPHLFVGLVKTPFLALAIGLRSSSCFWVFEYAPSRPHIIVDDLRVSWGTHVLMEHVTFEVKRGSVFAILGGCPWRLTELG
jgi:phospholipid/cholesterol/gamma-HCH transport system permease protein